MTREERKEAIQVIKNFPVESTKERKAVLTAIEALEQESCGDTISRQAAIASIKNLYPDMPIVDIMNARKKWLEKYAPYFECENAIEHLPPVNPQPKIGRCKDCKHFKRYDGYCYLFEPKVESEE